MNYTCENLSKVISDLSLLSAQVGKSIETFNPEPGKLAYLEAQKLIESWIIPAKFGIRNYEWFRDQVGGEANLLDRIERIELGGMGQQDKNYFKKLKLYYDEIAKQDDPEKQNDETKDALQALIFDTDDFLRHQNKKESVYMIRVTLEDLGVFNGQASYEELCQKATSKGLQLCPQDFGIYYTYTDEERDSALLLYDDTIMSEPFYYNNRRFILNRVGDATPEINLSYLKKENQEVYFGTSHTLIFCLRGSASK
jgi:hypothetical protein